MSLVYKLANDLSISLENDDTVYTASPCNEVFENCYLGDCTSAIDTSKLSELGITHVLNVASGSVLNGVCIDPKHYDDMDIKLLRLSVDDGINGSILPIMNEALDFMHTALVKESGKILVHCRAGVNRSAAIVLAYMMKHMDYRLVDAIDHVRKSRDILPYSNLLSELIDFEMDIFPEARKKMLINKDDYVRENPKDY